MAVNASLHQDFTEAVRVFSISAFSEPPSEATWLENEMFV
jgi:hypothetical protein